jgi:hypothetical protein
MKNKEIPKDAVEIIDMLKYRDAYSYFGSEMPKGYSQTKKHQKTIKDSCFHDHY